MFSNRKQIELQQILDELSQPAKSVFDMPRRIELCRQALTLVNKTEHDELWGALQGELANSLCQTPQGNRGDNIEQAITAYKQALSVMTKYALPLEWAATMNNLATAYKNRIRGNRGDNIEQAITAYKQTLSVNTKQALPLEWAGTMMNLANAYVDRIRGDRGDNIEQAIEAYKQALFVRTKQALPVEWANTMNNLANAYYSHIRGDRGDNIEQAIEAYKQALFVRTKQALPLEWATTMNNLATAYVDRIRGDRGDNIEQAIEYYKQALSVRTKQALTLDWATTMNNLANAYVNRIRGDKGDNIEQAIEYYKQALSVRTKQALPLDWAGTMMNLANAYYSRIRGDKGDNIEQAIEYYKQALSVNTKQALPLEWANTMNNLAIAYSNRIRGDRGDNIEQAIEYYKQALFVRTKQALPLEWATTMMNLASAYYSRIRGDRGDNIEQAIEHYKQALSVRTKQALPLEWAGTMNNLAATYSNRIRGDRGDNIEQAIEYYKQALSVTTKQALPAEWAGTMNNLALSYSNRIRGDRRDNIEQAIQYYKQALSVRTKQALPLDWAATIMNLANAYVNRIRGDRGDNIEQAVEHYKQALSVMTKQALPAEYQLTERNLGHLYFGERRWNDTIEAYQAAISAEKLLLAATYTEKSRRAEVAETAGLYARAAYALLKMGRYGEALEQLERGKTRVLAQTMALDEVDLSSLPEKQVEEITTLRLNIRTLENEIRLPPLTPARRKERIIIADLQKVRSGLNEIIETIRTAKPEFMPSSLELSEILALVPAGGAIVAPLVTLQGGAIFIIPHGTTKISDREIIWLDDFKAADLSSLLVGNEDKPGWLLTYRKLSQTPNKANIEAIQVKLEETCQLLWDKLIAPITVRLVELGISKEATILLMPQGGLGLLPLHAAWREVEGKKRAFLDDYNIIYAPGSYTFNISRHRLRQEERHNHTLLAVVNPTKDLRFTLIEGEQILKIFGEEVGSILKKETEMSVPIQYADLEIHLRHHNGVNYKVDLRFTQPNSDTETRLLDRPSDVELDTEELRKYHFKDEEYGQKLTDKLFANSDVKNAFNQIRNNARSKKAPLRIRLFIDDTASELHNLRWETVRDPDDPNSTLLTSEHYYFSRYLSSKDWKPVGSVERNNLKALVIIANPSDLDPDRFAPIDVDGELSRVKAGLTNISVTALASGGKATINLIKKELRHGYDILYLVCHGVLNQDNLPILWLENKEGEGSPVPGRDFITGIKELLERPHLVVLSSCQSAGKGEEETLAALGPQLVKIGVPAVLAMQGSITMKTVEQFMPSFFEELQKDGQIDRAMTVARATVKNNADWWVPVLFMCLKSGRLWRTPIVTDNIGTSSTVFNRKGQQVTDGSQPTTGKISTANLRRRLKSIFDDAELDAFCLDYFPQVYDKFSRGLRKDEKLTLLLDYCRREPERYQKLLNELEELT